ncbi:MAG: DUF2868 domain-containing protein [Thermoanaerobaculia bacterium]
MDEVAARETLLVRAYEAEPSAQSAWSEEDRAWATQAAAEVEGEQAADDRFLARRSALAIERLASRDKQVRHLLRGVTWRPWVAWALALLALVAGFAADALGTGRRINLLAPPLLGLLLWNLFVYLLLLGRGVHGLFSRHRRGPGPLARTLGRFVHGASATPGRRGGVPAAEFLTDWAQASARLTAARIGRVLHVGAIGFALGALGGIYLRGLAFEYRAGWESTFLNAGAVKALLGAALGPAAALTGIALPGESGYAALRFSAGPGAIAAPWLHLYAVTVALFVLAPRLLLALGDHWVEARQTTRFPLRLDEAYFKRLTRVLHGTPATVRVVPYSYQLSPAATLGLQELLTRTFGRRASVSVASSVAFGDEESLDARALAGGVTIVAPVFALTATPELENHGRFLDRLAEAADDSAQVAVIVDESGFRRQFPSEAGRHAERRALWQRLLGGKKCAAAFVDLEQPDLPAAEAALEAALDAAGAARR